MNDSTIDEILENHKATALVMSQKLKESAESVESADYEFQELVHAIEKLSRTLHLTIEDAPFLLFRTQFEGAENFREWLLDSQEFVGDRRDTILEAIEAYQRDCLENTGYYTPPRDGQYTLL